MTKLFWNAPGQKKFESGLDRGVLYVGANPGVPWVGLTAVNETPTGGEPTPYYIDGVKYLNVPAKTEFAGTLEAYTYPDEFGECLGVKEVDPGMFVADQGQKPFGMSYRTRVGNDLEGQEAGYKVHVLYGCLASPAQPTYTTMSSSSAPTAFSWGITTTPLIIPGYMPISHVTMDFKKSTAGLMNAVESILYGTSTTNPRLPSIEELKALYVAYVVDGGVVPAAQSYTYDGGVISPYTTTTDAGRL